MKDTLKEIKLNENTISMFLGILVIVLFAAWILRNYLPGSKVGQTSSTKIETPTSLTKTSSDSGYEMYTTKRGDSLWSLAMKYYQDGYKWEEIYEKNADLIGTNPNILNIGQEIQVPKVQAMQLTAFKGEYQVKPGDNLWKIATNLCDDGYKWGKIAAGNDINRPNLIYPGMNLKIECE